MPTSPTLIKLKTEAARSFLRDVTNENDVFHVFFGKTEHWPDDNNPPAVEDTRLADAEAHTEMIAVKRIGANDVAYLIPKVLWTSGTIYDRYTDDADLSTLNFYVYNEDNYCIYKCLNRQDYIDGSTPVPSTVKPADSTGTEKFRTSDGYWWKMVYLIPETDRVKFIDSNNTSSYLPIRFIPSNVQFDVMGHIKDITINNSGSGYTTPPSVVITGDGTGAYATATINTYGEVNGIRVVQEGHGYSFVFVTLISDSGTDCVATANLEPDGPTPEDTNVMVAATAQATAGAIEFIDIIDGGQNYSADSQFAVEGDGSGATLIVTIDDAGKVSSISTSNMGKGYTHASIVSTGSGENAVLRPIISPIWGHGGNAPTELLATVVGIVVEVETPFTPPTPEGDFFRGNDFRQIGVIKNIRSYGVYGNVFNSYQGDPCYVVSVTDLSGYNLADIIATGDGSIFRVEGFADVNEVRLSPIRGVITSGSTVYNVTTSSALNPVGVVFAPETASPLFEGGSGDACYKIIVSDINSYNLDDIIVSDTGGRFVVIEKNPFPHPEGGDEVKLLPISDHITINSVLANETTSPTLIPPLEAIVSLTAPEINKKTGDIIYLKNTSPYLRQLYQTESVKLYLQF